jgi:hypothetical protein
VIDAFASLFVYNLTASVFDLHDGIGMMPTYCAYGIGWKSLRGRVL